MMMKKLLVAAIVLTLSAQSFGAVLVYKVSEKLKGYQLTWNSESFVKDVNVAPDPNDPNTLPPFSGFSAKLESAKTESLKFRGYLITDVNTESLLMNDVDTGVALVLVDNEAKTFTVVRTMTDANGNPDPNFGSAQASMYPTSVLNKKGIVTKPEAVLFDCQVFDKSTSAADVNDPNTGVGTSNTHSTLNWDLITMTGKVSLVDITGTKVKVGVPKSLKGQGTAFKVVATASNIVKNLNSHAVVTTDSDVAIEDDVFGSTTIKLDTRLTRNANGRNLSFSAAVADLISQLKNKGYTQTQL
jgi:hypothetical protein